MKDSKLRYISENRKAIKKAKAVVTFESENREENDRYRVMPSRVKMQQSFNYTEEKKK